MSLILKKLVFSTTFFPRTPCVISAFRSSSSQEHPVPLRSRKKKSQRPDTVKTFKDSIVVKTIGGKGGDGCISFMRLWCNPEAGPDGGDGGSGGHVILEASRDVTSLSHVTTILAADSGEKGYSKDCHGRNAAHTVVKVPIGTVVMNSSGLLVGDLSQEKAMFLASRGGAGGKGNHFFVSDTNQAPGVAEYGAEGEEHCYILEMTSVAHVGLIGFPNAGKSTLLRAVSRARPKVAPYPFTTLHPHIGIINYSDHKQIAVADLPGLIPDSHRNRGLGISFLKHAERCSVLLYLIDASNEDPWEYLAVLRDELGKFSPEMCQQPCLVVANKIDLPAAEINLPQLESKSKEIMPISTKFIPISAKMGTNLNELLYYIRRLYDEQSEYQVEVDGVN